MNFISTRKTAAVVLSSLLLDPCGLGARLAAAAELRGIEVSSDQLTVTGDQALKYNTFVTAHPPRLVMELLDTRDKAKTKSLAGQGRFLTRVRAGQFASKPTPVTRIVMDLTEPVPYKVESKGKDLIVKLDEPQTEVRVIGGVPLKDVPAATLLAQKPPELSESMPSKDVDTSIPAVPTASSSYAAAKPAAKATAKGDVIDQMSTEPEDFHADSMDVRDVLRLLGEKAHINVVYGPDVAGTLTLHLTQVPFRDIFRTVLNMQGLVTEQVGDKILRVMTPAVYSTSRQNAVPQTKIFTLSYAKASDIRTQLDTVRATEGRRGVSVTDDKTNSIIVTDSPEGLEEASRLIGQLDKRPSQVLIEAKLVEVQLTKTFAEGIQWTFSSADPSKIGGKDGTNLIGNSIQNYSPIVGGGSGGPYLQSATPNTIGGGTGQSGLAGGAVAGQTGVNLMPSGAAAGAFSFGRITNNFYLNAQIAAAASKGKAKVLSDPKVATLNNQRAVIQITTQLPYVTSNLTATGVAQQNVSFLTTGITLTVTPTINADGHITLAVKPEVSRPGVTEPKTGARGSDTRSTDTTVLVKDGETIVIGGLISDTADDTVTKVPLLGDIPIVGWLFKSRSTDRTRQELLVFVTTRLMPD